MAEENFINASVESGPSTSAWPTSPAFDFSVSPRSIGTLAARDLSSGVRNNFFRSARWCADGSAVLSTAEDRVLRVHDTPTEGEGLDASERSFTQPDAIHATAWYPSATASSPETFCFMASIRDGPVRLIDASDGRIRATYPIVDHRERFVAPHSFAFNSTATKVYCGCENAIEVLDIASPGYDTSERLKTAFSRNEKGGQKGILSALAFAPDYSGTFAAGSFSGSVSVYSEDTGATPLQHLEGVTGGGVTQVAFHPLSPTTLFVASRRSNAIQIFDLRDTTAPMSEIPRPGDTNQRLSFDIDPWGRYLASGDSNGSVRVWDINDLAQANPIFEEKLHHSAVGSVQLHPYKPLLLSVSGSRSAPLKSDTDNEYDASDDESDSGEEDDTEDASSHRSIPQDQDTSPQASSPPGVPGFSTAPNSSGSTLKIWSFSPGE